MDANLTLISKILKRDASNTFANLTAANQGLVNDAVRHVTTLITQPLFQTINDEYFSLNLADITISALNLRDVAPRTRYTEIQSTNHFDIVDANVDLLVNHTNFNFGNSNPARDISFNIIFDIFSEYPIDNDFILRLARRVKALTHLYFNKPHLYGAATILEEWGVQFTEAKFVLFLQRNPRRSSKDVGPGRLSDLKTSKCFNCSNGLTEKSADYKVGLYRENEIFGLITHELMHFCNLDGGPSQSVIYDEQEYLIVDTEVVANSTGTIYHSIFNAFELNYTGTIVTKYDSFRQLMQIEIVHSLNQLVRLSRLLGITTWATFKGTRFTYGPGSMFMFSYILGRAVFFLNLEEIITTCSLDLNVTGLLLPDMSCLQNIVKRAVETANAANDALLEQVYEIMNPRLTAGNDEGNPICGNMSMEYFAIDLGTVDKDTGYNAFPNLYGGSNNSYYEKYMKYKSKYLELKNKLKL